MLHFKNETVQLNEYYFFYYLNNSIKLLFFCSMSFYLKNLFITETSKIKHFQQQINIYNNAMIFISYMFNQDECLNHSVNDIQSFVIYKKLYHLQESLQHLFIYISLFTQAYLYDPQTATEYWFINTNESLCKFILLQLAEILHKCNNLFINIYCSVKKILNQHQ